MLSTLCSLQTFPFHSHMPGHSDQVNSQCTQGRLDAHLSRPVDPLPCWWHNLQGEKPCSRVVQRHTPGARDPQLMARNSEIDVMMLLAHAA